MMAAANRDGRPGPAADRLVVVSVEEAINPALTGRHGVTYQSPPQELAQAMALVRLLLGCQNEPTDSEMRWVRAIAGGRRTVTVKPG